MNERFASAIASPDASPYAQLPYHRMEWQFNEIVVEVSQVWGEV